MVGQTFHRFRGVGSGPRGMLSVRRLELFIGAPGLFTFATPAASLSMGKSRIPANGAVGRTKPLEVTLRRSTCKLWYPTTPAIRWIFEEAGAGGCPLYVNESSAVESDVFDCAFIVTKPTIVHVRGGDLFEACGCAWCRPRECRGQRKTLFFLAGSLQRSADRRSCSGAWAARRRRSSSTAEAPCCRYSGNSRGINF